MEGRRREGTDRRTGKEIVNYERKKTSTESVERRTSIQRANKRASTENTKIDTPTENEERSIIREGREDLDR